jgi:hypothetical protein
MTPRQKADDITRYIRKQHNLSPAEFMLYRMTAEPEEPGSGILSAKEWSKRICTLLVEKLDLADTFAQAGVPLDSVTIKQARQEMQALVSESVYFGKWDHNTAPNIRAAVQDIKDRQHVLFDFLSAITTPFNNPASNLAKRDMRIAILISNLCNMAARNTSSYFAHLVGNNMAHQGLRKRGQEFLCSIGYSASYHTLLEDRDKIASDSKASNSDQSTFQFQELIS